MPDNVYEVLKSTHPQLVDNVLDKNEEISKFLMLVYSHLLYTAMDRPWDPKDIVLTYGVIESKGKNDLLQIQIKYYESRESKSNRLEGKNPVKRNLDLVKLLSSNSNVRDVALRVVELLERWINEKPYRKKLGLKSIKLENQMFWKNLVLKAEIMLHVE